MNNFKVENWLPQEPWQGPPLPEFLKIHWPWYKPPEPGEAAAAIGIEILGLERHSPMVVDEGKTYTVRVTVTNASTKGGVPWGATLELRVRATGDGTTLIPTTDKSASFAAGESKTFSYTMSIPMGLGGGSGVIDAVVTSPPGGILASDTEYLTIIAVAIEYGATVVIS